MIHIQNTPSNCIAKYVYDTCVIRMSYANSASIYDTKAIRRQYEGNTPEIRTPIEWGIGITYGHSSCCAQGLYKTHQERASSSCRACSSSSSSEESSITRPPRGLRGRCALRGAHRRITRYFTRAGLRQHAARHVSRITSVLRACVYRIKQRISNVSRSCIK